MAGIAIHKDHKGADDFVVIFKKGTQDAAIQELCQKQCTLQGHPSQGGVAFASIHGRQLAQKLISQFKNLGKIELIEADTEDSITPEIEIGKGSLNDDKLWNLDRIGAPSQFDGSGVTIFVQDTGVKISHDEFSGRASAALDMSVGGDEGGSLCSPGTQCAEDRQGHGTHCAGSAAGKTFGVAPNALIRAIKTLGDNGRGSRSWQYTGIDHVAASGIRPVVLSMSLGGRGRDSVYPRVFNSAVESGVVVVVASGNEESDGCNFSPGFVDEVISVGSIDQQDARSWFSNWGSCVDIWAPGSDIISAGIESDTDSDRLSGTSMACPHVSGAAALVLQQHKDWKFAAVLEKMHATGEKGAISDLTSNDTNILLWVGDGDAAVPAPTPPSPGPTENPCPSYCNSWACFLYDDCVRDGCC